MSRAGVDGQPAPLGELLEVGVAAGPAAQAGLADSAERRQRLVLRRRVGRPAELPADEHRVLPWLLNSSHGYVEVEIFNTDIWEAPAEQTANTVVERFAAMLG